MKNIAENKFKSELKFVYSDNDTLSIIFQKNEILLGVVGEFNNNIKQLEEVTNTNIYTRGNSILVKSSPKKNELVKEIKFINSFSFIFSPRPGTKASNLEQVNKDIAKERLLKIQEYLFKFQLNKNKSFINNSIDVLVENKLDGQKKLFGRNFYMNSVIFEGNKNFIGKNLNIKIEHVNQNSLFGKIEKNNMRAA